MLPHLSLLANVVYAQANMPLEPGDAIVSFLPLAHAFGCAFEFLFPFTSGCAVTFLAQTPSPKIILDAFGSIRPRLILSVPLVIEKIYAKRLAPVLEKEMTKILMLFPPVRRILQRKIKEKLVAVFGGRFREIVIGGAALNGDVERFFRAIGFPFEVKLNSLPFVAESLVIERNGRLFALVYPDLERVDQLRLDERELVLRLEKNRLALNKVLPAYAAIARIDVYSEEFQKTPTKKIKRFLYSGAA